MEELKFLEEQQVASELIKRVEEFRSQYEVVPETAGRIVKPSIPFYGKDILEMAIAGLLKGENLLLTGPKATGKNILAENLAYIFNRPAYNVSFHVNTNSGDLIGTDTFVDNEVKLRKGTIYQCADTVVSESSTRLIWQRTMQFPFFMQLWIIAVPSMFRAMTKLIFIRLPVLSEP